MCWLTRQLYLVTLAAPSGRQQQLRNLIRESLYIDGAWVAPATCQAKYTLTDPATEAASATIAFGDAADVDRAVAAARRAFPAFSASSRADRIALLRSILAAYESRVPDIAEAMTKEMGVPVSLARGPFTALFGITARQTIATLEEFEFERLSGTTLIVHEPIGVCGLISAWNSPMFIASLKLMPALAAGCTIVFKPSEQAPLSAAILAEVFAVAGVPTGVFNLVQGDGPGAGGALAAHPDVDMISFTGSVAGGVEVARAAAPSIKRVVQELGGKSANILLPDADFKRAVPAGVAHCFNNSGQICVAPTRMLVPRERHEEVKSLAREAAAGFVVGDPRAETTRLGPVASKRQFEKVQAMIRSGIEEGAELVAGGTGRPPGLPRGFYVKPTVFANVRNDMRIAREEIFGPVLSILPYADEEEAISIANDSAYGLSGFVQGADSERAKRVARRLRTGTVNINEPKNDPAAPIGGYRRSGNGREKGAFGLMEYLETKALVGFGA